MTVVSVKALALSLLAALLLAPCVTGQTAPASDGWRSFEGSLSATGTRQTLATEGENPAAIVQVSGSVVLQSSKGLGRGFRCEAIFFWDGASVGAGRAVWTDEHGDRIFSALKGDAVATGKVISGAVTGGTGRYAGVEGEYSFHWQYVVEGEDGVIQGQGVGLVGRIRRAGASK